MQAAGKLCGRVRTSAGGQSHVSRAGHVRRDQRLSHGEEDWTNHPGKLREEQQKETEGLEVKRSGLVMDLAETGGKRRSL